MTSRSDERRSNRKPIHRVTIVTVLLALALVVCLGAALWATSGGRDGATALLGTSTPPPAPRPDTPSSQEGQAPTPIQGAEEGPTLTVGTNVGQLAPDFTLATLDGEMSLSEFRGQVVLLNFWASWCGPCRVEFPDLKEVYEEYKDQGFTIVAVNLGENKETAASFAQEFELDFTIMLDTNAGVARLYGAYSIPTSYFLDSRGVVQEVRVGAMRKSFVEGVVQRLLEAEQASP